MALKPEVLTQVQSLAASLSISERQAMIEAIANMMPRHESETPNSLHYNELLPEQNAWFAKPMEERQRYHGEYVAVRNGEVVDHDPDRQTLYLRVRARFGRHPALITYADWTEPRVFTFNSIHQEV